MYALLDHPVIRWMERTGYPSWAQEKYEDNGIEYIDDEEEEEDEDGG